MGALVGTFLVVELSSFKNRFRKGLSVPSAPEFPTYVVVRRPRGDHRRGPSGGSILGRGAEA